MAACAVVAAACSRTLPPFRAPVQKDTRHRPPWTRTASTDVDAMVQCLEGREPPSYVLLVYHDPNRCTAMTTVDAFGALEHCVVDQGVVTVRQPAVERLEDVEALPLFSLGAARPSITDALALEEVVFEGEVLGWLVWREPHAAFEDAPALQGADDSEE